MIDERALREIPGRPLAGPAPEIRFAMRPGDLPLIEAGQEVEPGDPLVDHARDPRVEEITVDEAGDRPTVGARWPATGGTASRSGPSGLAGVALAPLPAATGRWRLITAEHRDTLLSPVAGAVSSVVAGAELRIRARGLALAGALAAGSAARGTLELATDPFGELRPGGIDVGRAGSVLVVGPRIDAEALTRARAMGVRGIVVASLPGKDMRDFLASERRQRASLHPTAPFGVLVLDGPLRRPIASPVLALLEALAGREVALVTDPPALVFDPEGVELPAVARDWVRVRHGADAGAEGRLVGVCGPRRFAAGVHLDAARVVFGDEPPVDLPIANLERLW